MPLFQNVDLLKEEKNFIYLTNLINAKISGGIVSIDPPNDFQNDLAFLITKRYSFDCPYCERFIQTDLLENIYDCDCGLKIDTTDIEYEERYLFSIDIYQSIKEFFQQEFLLEYNKYKIVFGERMKKELSHDGVIYIHITPKDLWTPNVILIDDRYVDHFSIGWSYFLDLFDDKKRFDILSNLEAIRESHLNATLYQKDNQNLYLKDNTINFIHMSDFHIEGNANDNEKELIIENLINDLKKKILKDNIIDFVLITGDVTKSAENQQYIKAAKIIVDKLEDPIKGLNINREKIFVVPGNHDVNRNFFNNEIYEKITRSYREDKLRTFWYETMEGSDLYLNFKKLENFQKFQLKILRQNAIKPDKLFSFRIFEKYKYKIGILGLNTVWIGGCEGERGNLLMSKFQLIDAISNYIDIEDFNLKIAFFHHPIESLIEEEQDEIKSRICNNFDLVLFGHRHDTNYINIEDYKTDTHLIRAGPIYKSDKKIRGSYNLIQIDVKNRIARIIFRKPHKNNPEIYVYDNEASPYEKNLEYNGIFEFSP